MASDLGKRIKTWRKWRRLRQEHHYLVREIQRIVRLHGPQGACLLAGPFAPTRWDRARHHIKRIASLGLWDVYRLAMRRSKPTISPETISELTSASEAVSAAIAGKRQSKAEQALTDLDSLVGKTVGFARKSTVREYVESIGLAVLVALFLRAFVVEAFKIPSGSMIPTLEVGDHIFVNKFSYGLRVPFTKDPPKRFIEWGKPNRGDVVVFINRKNPENDFIKRIVALAGDEVKVERGVISLRKEGKGPWRSVKRWRISRPCHYTDFEKNEWIQRSECDLWGEELGSARYVTIVDRDRENREYPPLDLYRSTALPLGSLRVAAEQLYNPYRVPESNVFVMGDNRTNSGDSRYAVEVGFVPTEYIKGKALFVWSSWGPSQAWWGLRLHRIGRYID